MNCQVPKSRLNEYLDQELDRSQADWLEKHLSACRRCSRYLEELQLVGSLVGRKMQLPEASQQKILREIDQGRTRPGLLPRVWDRVYAYCRDLDRAVVWAKVGAVPITLAFFLLVIGQFTPPNMDFSFPVLTIQDWNPRNTEKPVMHTVNLRRSNAEIRPLLEVLWKMPYEDSMALVAEITPDGTAKIEDVLEYPRNRDLLHTLDQTFLGSHFSTGDISRPHMIFAFQKIDVYDVTQKGM